MADLTPAARALLVKAGAEWCYYDQSGIPRAEIEATLLAIQAEARVTAEAEIAALRALLSQCDAEGIVDNRTRHAVRRLLATPPTEPDE